MEDNKYSVKQTGSPDDEERRAARRKKRQRARIMAFAVLFVFAAAIYMNCGLGTAPYDAVSYLIHKRLFADKGRKVPFKAVRIAYDGIAMLIGLATGGGVGIVTIIMIPALGTAVDMVGKLLNGKNRERVDINDTDYNGVLLARHS